LEQEGNIENRKCVRVPVPPALFIAGALWIRPEQVPTRMHLLDLGQPDLRVEHGDTLLRFDNLSANGVHVTLTAPEKLGPALDLLKADRCLILLHLKLAQPLSAVEERPLSLLLGLAPVFLREGPDGSLGVGMNILYRGQPDRDAKSLTFFYVAKYPIRELAAWCDEVTLMDRVPTRPVARGLRMDRFLLELDTALDHAEAQQSQKTQEQDG
jgi:hypothetical protein